MQYLDGCSCAAIQVPDQQAVRQALTIRACAHPSNCRPCYRRACNRPRSVTERCNLVGVPTYAVIGQYDTLAAMLQRKHSVLKRKIRYQYLEDSRGARLHTSTQLIPLITMGFPTAIFWIQATSSQLRSGSTYANWAALVDADPDSRLASLGGCNPDFITSPSVP